MRFQNPHLDAADNAFLERQLEYVKAKVYEKRYPEFKARRLIPVSHEVPSGAEAIAYEEYDGVGVAKLLASYADDLPRADVLARKVVQPVKGIGAAYGYNLQEIRAAVMANRPLQQQKASRAARAVEQVQDQIAANGGYGLVGLLSITNALAYTIPNGASPAQATWIGGKTPQEILKDMHGIAQYVVNQTNGVERPDTMIMPEEQYGYIAVTRIDNTIETTILQHFLKTSPYITSVEPWVRCKGAGAASKDRLGVYRRDPDFLTLEIPQEFEQLAPEQRGLETVVACHARTGGVICPIPMSVAYGDGI
jgi:hypothetical protein